MIYERGAGVPKDLAAALNWYRQSATNGYAEAAVVLGNYYSDGLEVKQDHAEAFVWYSVAAAEGTGWLRRSATALGASSRRSSWRKPRSGWRPSWPAGQMPSMRPAPSDTDR